MLNSWIEVSDSVSKEFAQRGYHLLSISTWPGGKNEMNQRLLLVRTGDSNLVLDITYVANGNRVERVDYKSARTTDKNSLSIIEDKSKLLKVDERIKNIIISLKKSGYIIATITNTNKFHFDFHRKIGHYKDFDVVIASCEVGLQKPDERIYLMLIEKLGLKPEEIVFIDNFEDNLTTAERIGMKTITYKDPEHLKESLSDLGIKLSD